MNLDFFFIRNIWIWIWIYYFYLGSDMDFEKSDPNPIRCHPYLKAVVEPKNQVQGYDYF